MLRISIKRIGGRAFAAAGFALAALFLAAACKPAPAQAQTAKLFSVQVGIGDQMTSKARRQVGSDSLHVGASLNFGNGSTLFVLPGTQSADFDYNYASAHGGRLNAYSLMYANRVYLVPHLAQSVVHHVVPYVGFGIGAIDTEVRRPFATGHTSGNKTNLGGKLMLGVDLPSNLFVEGSYILSAGSADGVRPDSLNIAVGLHF